jgi:hypothetical protein
MHHLTDFIGELGQANAVSISERLYGVASVTAPVRSADNQLMGGDASDFTFTTPFTVPICLGLEANGHNRCHKPAVGPAGRVARRGWRDA